MFTAADLRRAVDAATDSYDREHVTPWLRRNVPTLDYVPRDSPGDPLRYRCTVDVLSDYDRVCRLFADLDDPIAVPWQRIVQRIDDPEFSAGPSVPVRDRSDAGQSVVMLGGTQFADELAPRPEVTRALLATAVARGVNHLEVGRSDGRAEHTVHACGEPQLTRRLRIVSRLAPTRGDSDDAVALSVEASLERTFAELGRRSVASALLSSPHDARVSGGVAWTRLQEYRAEGAVSRIGVHLEDPADLDDVLALPHLGHVELPLSILDRRFSEIGTELDARGVLVTTYGTFDGGRLLDPGHPAHSRLDALARDLDRAGIADLALAFVLGHPFVTSVAIGARSVAQIEEDLELSTRSPLTPGQLDAVREGVRDLPSP